MQAAVRSTNKALDFYFIIFNVFWSFSRYTRPFAAY